MIVSTVNSSLSQANGDPVAENDTLDARNESQPLHFFSTSMPPLWGSLTSEDNLNNKADVRNAKAENDREFTCHKKNTIPFKGKVVQDAKHLEPQVIIEKYEPSPTSDVKYVPLLDDEQEDGDNKTNSMSSIKKRRLLTKLKKKQRQTYQQPPLELSQGICTNKGVIYQRSFGDTEENIEESSSDTTTQSSNKAKLDLISDLFDQEHVTCVKFKEKVNILSEEAPLEGVNNNGWKCLINSMPKFKYSRSMISSRLRMESSTAKNSEESSFGDDDCGSIVEAINTELSTVDERAKTNYVNISLREVNKLKSAINSKTDNEDDTLTVTSRIDPYILKTLKQNVRKGDFFSKMKKYEQAIDHYMDAFNVIKSHSEVFSKQSKQKLLNRLGDVQYIIDAAINSAVVLKIGVLKENRYDYIRALKYYTIAYRLRRSALGADHISLVIILNMLAEVQAKRKEYDEALQIYKMANNIKKRSNSKERNLKSLLPSLCLKDENSFKLFMPPPDSLLLRGEGLIYEQRGQLRQALELYHQSLKCSTQNQCSNRYDFNKGKILSRHSPRNVIDLTSPTVLSTLPLTKSTQSVLSDITQTSSSSTVTISSASSLSFDNYKTHLIIGEQNDNLEVMYEPISMYDLTLTKDDVDIAITLIHIGHVQRRLNNSNIALHAYRCALRGMKAAFGEKHSNVAALLGNIGNIYKEMGNFDKAIKIYRRVLRIESETLGASHSEITVTMHNMGTIEYCRKNYDFAIKLFARAMQIQTLRYGRNHPVIAVTANNLGEAYEKLGNFEMALQMYRESLRVNIKNLGRDNTDVAKSLHKIGLIHRDMGKNAVATMYCNKALDLFQKHIDKQTSEGIDDNEQYILFVRQIARDIANMSADAALVAVNVSLDSDELFEV